jgi:Erg28 like protein
MSQPDILCSSSPNYRMACVLAARRRVGCAVQFGSELRDTQVHEAHIQPCRPAKSVLAGFRRVTRGLIYIRTVTPLQARTFGIWTLTSAVVRLYAAYNITNKVYARLSFRSRKRVLYPFSRVYDMAFFTYLIAFAHFSSELLIFKTASINPGVMSPVIVSSKPGLG